MQKASLFPSGASTKVFNEITEHVALRPSRIVFHVFPEVSGSEIACTMCFFFILFFQVSYKTVHIHLLIVENLEFEQNH